MSRYTQREYLDAQRAWLQERCGHAWAFKGKQVRCQHCNRKQARNVPALCPKRKKPNRWQVHWRRHWQNVQGTNECPHCKRFSGSWRAVEGHVYREHFPLWLADRMRRLEGEAKGLPQTDRYWKQHPVAVEYRKRVTQWWALSAEDYQLAAPLSPTATDMLTAKGTLAAQSLGDTYLDRMYAKRRRLTRIESGRRFEWTTRTDEEFCAAQEWRRQCGFTPLPLEAA